MRGLEEYSSAFKHGMALCIIGLVLQWSAAITTLQHVLMAVDVVLIATGITLIIVQAEGRQGISNWLLIAICIAMAVPALLNLAQVVRLHLKYKHTGIPAWTPVVGLSGSVLLVIGSVLLLVAPETRLAVPKADYDGDAEFKAAMAIGICGQVLSWLANAVYRSKVALEIIRRARVNQPLGDIQCVAIAFQSFMIGLQLLMLIVTLALVIVRVERRKGLSRVIPALGGVGMIGFAVGQIVGILIVPGGCEIDQAVWSKIIGCVGAVFIIISAFLFVLAPESRQSKNSDEAAQLRPQGLVYASASVRLLMAIPTTAQYKAGLALALLATIGSAVAAVLSNKFLKGVDYCNGEGASGNINCQVGLLLTAMAVSIGVAAVLLATLVWLSSEKRSGLARTGVVFLCIILALCGVGVAVLSGLLATESDKVPTAPVFNTAIGAAAGILASVAAMLIMCSADAMSYEGWLEVYGDVDEDDGEVEGATWKEFFDKYKEEEEKDSLEYQQLLSRQGN
ncbi:hypothetical protein FOZ61_001235 [Perkinsus olseni]|uniref:Uncharacterized protein n=1 Tax=Perkinsus olseni TaxID=32597 RepID=A0A7J6MFM0_PEROL|nr:hypothetical protein FOZ61_001235 [Perkinsus olseni]KAF4675343.1 hypothetical protein FOL46_001975 [Perkinsus olseni]